LIDATETGERALIPYRWEQIGSKRLTSSRMQRRSPRHGAVDRHRSHRAGHIAGLAFV